MTESARLGLPMMQPGQAQKELTHNEALTLIDIAAQPVVVAMGPNAPPDAPVPGACWIVGPAPTGSWTGHAHAIAGWTEGGWRFVVPHAGFGLWCTGDATCYRYDGTVWHVAELAGSRVVIDGNPVVGARRAAIGDSVGGTVVDVQARDTITAILGALRGHGLIA